ncbi:MAG: hypothetical protein KBT35_01650 [Firmicutes bacterium]|nr:hypothetical protein [Candidatus Colivicinus equi]
MFNVEEILNKYNINEETYEELLTDCSNKICGVTDLDWSEIVDKYNLGIASDTLRKAQQVPLVGGSFIRDYYLSKSDKSDDTDKYNTELQSQLRELERKKIQYRDERNAWNKQNYTDARIEQKFDYLENVLSNFGKINFKNTNNNPIVQINENEMIICLSDLHIGETFSSAFGSYNSDIAVERISKYLESVKENAELYKVSKANIVLLGDNISGSIHHTIQVTNRENVIEQIKKASEIITSFCYECTKIFNNVDFYSVAGNHSRMDKKEDALHDERLDDLIAWIVNSSLSHIENFKYIKNIYDNGIATFNICGKNYAACHGDFDAMDKNGVANLTMMLGYIPYAVLRGHNHYPAFNEVSGVKFIQSGSLPGSGDQYTVEKRLVGKPSQTICICNNSGIKAHIPVEL